MTLPTLPRRAIRCVASLVFALGFTALSVESVAAQDFDAVGRRLREAVAQGELTAEQARTMMQALRKSAEESARRGERERSGAPTDPRVELRRKIAEAVRNGELSREEAAEKFAEWMAKLEEEERAKRGADEQQASEAEAKRRLEELTRRLRAAVQAGEITREQAKQRLDRARQAIEERLRRASEERREPGAEDLEARFERIEARLKAAVERGDMTEKEAWERYEALKKQAAEQAERQQEQQERGKKRFEALLARIKAAVEAGDLTAEEAEKKIEELRRKMAGESRRGR